jgi:ADP-ribose pyrophosphatase YjhB (NUDIX family)
VLAGSEHTLIRDYREVASENQVYKFCPRCAAWLHDELDTARSVLRPTCDACGWVYYPKLPLLALVVVEADADADADSGIVLVHPPSGSPDAPASLPSGLVEYPETPEAAAIRIAFEQTGLVIDLVAELTRFLQDGTPYGPALMFGYTARAVGGTLTEGDEGPPVIYALAKAPPMMPIRVANQRVLAAYLE